MTQKTTEIALKITARHADDVDVVAALRKHLEGFGSWNPGVESATATVHGVRTRDVTPGELFEDLFGSFFGR